MDVRFKKNCEIAWAVDINSHTCKRLLELGATYKKEMGGYKIYFKKGYVIDSEQLEIVFGENFEDYVTEVKRKYE